MRSRAPLSLPGGREPRERDGLGGRSNRPRRAVRVDRLVNAVAWDAVDVAGVAERLFGKPTRRTSTELRYGTHGSLSVDLAKRCWYSHETGAGGGVSSLVERELGCDWREARGWLAEHGFIASLGACAAPGEGAKTCSGGAQGAPEADREAAAARIKRAHSLHDPSVAIGGTPGERYLERRGVRVHGVSGVRWLDAAVAPPGPVRGWAGLPGAAAGAVVYVWRTLDSGLSAISLEAVDGLGRRLDELGLERFRRTVGVRAGALFVPLEACAQGATHVAEGEVDALALAGAAGPGEGACAAGSAGGLAAAAPLLGGCASVVVHADGDGPGRVAAGRLASALRTAGVPCKAVRYALGTDPADAPSPSPSMSITSPPPSPPPRGHPR